MSMERCAHFVCITTLRFGKSIVGQQFQFCSTKRMYQSNYSFSMPKPYHSIDMPKTFPEDIECIIKGKTPEAGSLYISNVEAASNPNTLKKLKITSVLSCAKGYELKHPRTVVPHYKYIPTVDHDQCDISIHFDQAVAFIEERLRHTNVLVHCIAGVSRSVSMVLAYFIKEHNMHYDEAYRLVKSKRKIIHPNDGFIKQLKKYSDTLKEQKKNARKSHAASNASPREDLSATSVEKKENNFLDRTMPDFKSIQLSPHKDVTPKKNADPRGELLDRYSSAQLKTPPPNKTSIGFTRDEPFQSLQHIPDSEQLHNSNDSTLTPKAKNEQIREKYDLVRTSTNYFTPNKTTLVNQKPYESIRKYEDYKSTRLDRPMTSSAANKPSASPLQAKLNMEYQGRGEGEYLVNRGEYFASKNNELNDKIEMIRRKYAAEREKLFTKYQSPQREQQPPSADLQQQTAERRRVSLGEYKSDRPATTRPYDFIEEKKYGLGRTEVKPETYKKMTHFESYGELYSKNYQRASLNEEESYSTRMEKSIRNNYEGQRNNYEGPKREFDRLGGFGGAQFAYPSYSPYYKYGSSYKRYY